MFDSNISSMARLTLISTFPPRVLPLFSEPGEQSVPTPSSRNSPSHLLLFLSLAGAVVHRTA